jgi:hypothetical protein
MFRKLEEKRFGKKFIENDKSPEDKCVCACKSPQEKESQPQPESTSMLTKMGVHYDISG